MMMYTYKCIHTNELHVGLYNTAKISHEQKQARKHTHAVTLTRNHRRTRAYTHTRMPVHTRTHTHKPWD